MNALRPARGSFNVDQPMLFRLRHELRRARGEPNGRCQVNFSLARDNRESGLRRGVAGISCGKKDSKKNVNAEAMKPEDSSLVLRGKYLLKEPDMATSILEARGGCIVPRAELRGYHIVYREHETNFCPGCGHTHWYIGRTMAECAFCTTALPLENTSMVAGGQTWRTVRGPVFAEAEHAFAA